MSGAAFSVGLGGRLLSWLDLGVGLALTTASRAISDAYIPDATYQETAYIQTKFKVDLSLVPYFGLTVRPAQPWSFSATLHLPSASSIQGGTDVQMWNYPYEEGEDSLTQHFEFDGGYEPLRAGLGVAYRHPRESGVAWGVAAEARYARWSAYRNRHNEAPEDAWDDTVSASAGGQVVLGAHTLGLDLAYTPTPVPAQTGRSNYVDNARAAAALSWQLAVPLAGRNWSLGLQASVHRLFSRSVTKSPDAAHPVFDEFPDSVYVTTGTDIESSAGLQTNNPGYPGFSSEGWLFGVALTLGLEL